MDATRSSNASRSRSSSSRDRRSRTCAPCLRGHPAPQLARALPTNEETVIMNRYSLLLVSALALANAPASAGQAPFAASAPDFSVGGGDRVYAAEQFSNTVSVIDPSTNTNLGVIRLGDPQPMNLSPLYKGQVLVHGLGFSPDRKTLA